MDKEDLVDDVSGFGQRIDNALQEALGSLDLPGFLTLVLLVEDNLRVLLDDISSKDKGVREAIAKGRVWAQTRSEMRAKKFLGAVN